MVVFAIIAASVLLVIMFIFTAIFYTTPRCDKFILKDKHVLITGGSSGIGKAVGKLCISKGARVTIFARKQAALAQAKEEILANAADRTNQNVLTASVDVCADYEHLEKSVREVECENGPVDVLVCSAGLSSAEKFENTKPADLKYVTDVNLVGSMYAAHVVIPSMKSRQSGRIVFISSQAGQLGLFGFAAYCASKFGLRGLAEALQMELRAYNIFITLNHPPDTDTPCFEKENLTKPTETKLLCEQSGLYKPETIAQIIVRDLEDGKFISYVGVNGWMLSCMTSGVSPFTSAITAFCQVLLSSIFRFASLFVLKQMYSVVDDCVKNEQQNNSEKKKQ